MTHEKMQAAVKKELKLLAKNKVYIKGYQQMDINELVEELSSKFPGFEYENEYGAWEKVTISWLDNVNLRIELVLTAVPQENDIDRDTYSYKKKVKTS